MSIEAEPSERSRAIAWLVAAVFFIQLLDGTILATSLPQMAASFGTDAVALGIGFTVYLLTMAGLIPLAGWLADRLGAREILVAAVLGFAAASRPLRPVDQPRRLRGRPRRCKGRPRR